MCGHQRALRVGLVACESWQSRIPKVGGRTHKPRQMGGGAAGLEVTGGVGGTPGYQFMVSVLA